MPNRYKIYLINLQFHNKLLFTRSIFKFNIDIKNIYILILVDHYYLGEQINWPFAFFFYFNTNI